MADVKDKPANFDEIVGKIRTALGWRAEGLKFAWVVQIERGGGQFVVVSRNVFVTKDGMYVASPGWDALTRTEWGPMIAARDIVNSLNSWWDKGPMEEPA